MSLKLHSLFDAGLDKLSRLPLSGQLGVGVGAFLVLGVLYLLVPYLVGRKNPRAGAIAFTAQVGLFTALLTWEALHLPEPRSGVFVVSHQIIRADAALNLTLFVVCLLATVMPSALNWFERGDFISFVAARHVRAKKSGFLTIISLLSILGVAISSFALCAVISIMGGFGADLKTKILNNNANVRIESPDAGGFEYWREMLDAARLTPGVAAATPVAGGEVMASSSTTRSTCSRRASPLRTRRPR